MRRKILDINDYDRSVILQIQMFIKGEIPIADFAAECKESQK